MVPTVTLAGFLWGLLCISLLPELLAEGPGAGLDQGRHDFVAFKHAISFYFYFYLVLSQVTKCP